MPLRLFRLFTRAASVAVVATFATPSLAAVIGAVDAYYVFRGVSANTTRLLADKAPAIGFPDIPSISFLLFDPATLPGEPLGPRNLVATLELQHDPAALAGTLIPASDSRPVSLGVYGVSGVWTDTVGGEGNKPDIVYGDNGAAAIDATLVGDPGLYRWNVTALVDQWIGGLLPPILAISGVFGNVDIDGRNSYATFHTVGSTTGLAPALTVAAIPLPATAPLLVAALSAVAFLRRRRLAPAQA